MHCCFKIKNKETGKKETYNTHCELSSNPTILGQQLMSNTQVDSNKLVVTGKLNTTERMDFKICACGFLESTNSFKQKAA
jgi:hypothetical protein